MNQSQINALQDMLKKAKDHERKTFAAWVQATNDEDAHYTEIDRRRGAAMMANGSLAMIAKVLSMLKVSPE